MSSNSGIDILQAYCTAGILNFTKYMFLRLKGKKFIVNGHHKIICDALDDVIDGKIQNLIINIAPRYSKTELVIKNFTAYGLALNPRAKFIELSYSDSLAKDNSDEIRDIVKSDAYQELFPYVKVTQDTDSKKKWNTTAGGGVYATSTGGQVTGFGAGEVDYSDEESTQVLNELLDTISEIDKLYETEDFGGAILIDDPLKPEDALSDIKRATVNKRFINTIRSRTNSRKTPIIIIMQRLHEDDLCGYLLRTEPDNWTVISLPCLYEEDGEMKSLWPKKHTVDELLHIKNTIPYEFQTQYQQNPMPLEGLLCPMSELRFESMDSVPIDSVVFRFSVGDPADTGGDHYSMPFMYVVADSEDFAVYVTDVIHNKNGIEANSPRIVDKAKEYAIEQVFLEYNGVGRAAVISVKNELSKHTRLVPFTSSISKEIRILSNYEFIKKYFVFDKDYEQKPEYKVFIHHLTTYLKEGDNKHKKDAIDVLCSAAKALKAKYRSILYE